MNAEEIVDRVSQLCPGLDPVRAHDITVVTMRTLAEHLAATQADAIAAVMPAVFSEAFDAARREKRAEPIEVSLAAFEEQLMMRGEIDERTAAEVDRAVVRVLRAALRDENAGAMLELPPELDKLVED